MRLLWHFFAACVVLLQSMTSRGMRTYAAARNLSSLPLVVAKTESVKPERSAQQDSIKDTIYDERRQHDEARSGMWDALRDARDILGTTGHFLEGQLHANKALMVEEKIDVIVTHAKVHQWFLGAYKRGHFFRSDDFITKVLQSGQGKVMAEYFLLLQRTALKSHAETAQREFLAECPEVLPLVFEVWLSSGVGPIEAYRMMPIPADISLKGAGGWKSSLHTRYLMLEMWMRFVDMCRAKTKKLGFSHVDEATLLQKDRDLGDVVRFLMWVRGKSAMRKRTSMVLGTLAKYEIGKVGNLQRFVNVWLELNISPEDVYHLMPMISRRDVSRQDCTESTKMESFIMLKRWLDYVDKYRLSNPDFGDDQMINVLVDKRPKDEVDSFFKWLEDQHGTTDRAFLLPKGTSF